MVSPPASRGTAASASGRGDVWLLLTLLVLMPAVAAGDAGDKAPRIEIDDQRRLILTGLPPILTSAGVKDHLTTGLTTSVTFLLDHEGIIRHIHPGGQYVEGDDAYAAMHTAITEQLARLDSNVGK